MPVDLPDDGIVELSGKQLRCLVPLLRQSFAAQAKGMGFNAEYHAQHPAFMTESRLQGERGRGVRFWAFRLSGQSRGCVALKHARAGEYRVLLLAVEPAFQGRGIGQQLLSWACWFASRQQAKCISVGVASGDAKLLSWYKRGQFVIRAQRKSQSLGAYTILVLQLS